MLNRWPLFVALILSLLFPLVNPIQAQDSPCILTLPLDTLIEVYAQPDPSAPVLQEVPEGITELLAQGRTIDTTWYFVELEGGQATGWIVATDIASADAGCTDLPVVDPASQPSVQDGRLETCLVTVAGAEPVAIYTDTDNESDILASIDSSTALTVRGISANSEWYVVLLQSGTNTGWVNADDVNEPQGTCDDLVVIDGSPTVMPLGPNAIRTDNINGLVQRNILPLQASPLTEIVWNHGNTRVAVTDPTGVKLFDYPDLRPVDELNHLLQEARFEDEPTAAAFTPDDRYLLVGYSDGRLQAVALNDGRYVDFVEASHESAISGIQFSPNNTTLLTTSGFIGDETPDEFDFSWKLFDFTTFDFSAGTMAVISSDFNTEPDQPFVDIAFVGQSYFALAMPDRLSVFGPGAAQSIERSPMPPQVDVQYANEAWFDSERYLLYSEGDSIRGLNVTVLGSSEVLFEQPDSLVIAYAQAPQQALLAVFTVPALDSPGTLIFTDGSSALRTLNMNLPVYALSFSPDSSALLIASGRGLEVWRR